MGTPRYMAPEQVTGEALDARSDLFAAGAILFEMLAGRPAFGGRNVVEILHATLHDQPPALTGSPAVAAVDRVIRRALAKRPAERPTSADAMADGAARRRAAHSATTRRPLARAMTRLVVLPFRVLRADPETDFLAFSLPDAIATSLSGFGSLVVRSSATAARFAGDAPDLKAIATEADVDRVVMGTLLRSGDQLRATAQLVEAPSGTLLTSHTVLSSLGDLFRLQDDIARRVVRGAVAAARGGAAPPRPTPRTTRGPTRSTSARTSWRAAYDAAPAGARSLSALPGAGSGVRARLGAAGSLPPGDRQVHRRAPTDAVARAEEALRRALELNPRLSVAHKFYANLEADMGHARQGDGATARRGQPSRQRPGAVRGAGPRLPLLRALRAVDRRSRARRGGSIRTSPRASSRRS